MTLRAPTRKIFYEVSEKSVTRLLSQMDRQPFSPSYGSWHRPFWHQRLSDFSSSACQQGMLSLALLYGIDQPGNSLYQDPLILQWIEASIRFLIKLQHADGSFDEWYPNEHGWAGPTGYVTYALAKSWALVGSELDPELRLWAEISCAKACNFIGKYEETDVLANHQAMALLAIAQVRETFPAVGASSDLNATYEKLWQRFEVSTQLEGWSLEYDGADPGYQTASLSFLARVHVLTGDARVKAAVAPMFDFIACFFFGETSFGGVTGSRSTRNLFHIGLEYWAPHFEMAETLAFHSRRMLEEGALLEPMDQEDHYLIYRIPEMLEAFLLAQSEVVKRSNLPSQSDSFYRVFSQAGIQASRFKGGYCVTHLKKGGALRAVFDNGKIVEDAGWVLSKTTQLCSSSYLRQDNRSSFAENHLSVKGFASKIAHPVFNVGSFILFRLTMKFLGFHPAIAKKLKKWIRSRIMTGSRPDRDVTFSREVDISGPHIEVRDTIRCSNPKKVRELWLGGVFVTRTVPQSKYFELHELKNSPHPLSASQLQSFRETGHLEIKRFLT